MFSKTRFNHTQFSRIQETGSLSGGEARAITTAQGTLRAIRYMSSVVSAVSGQESAFVRQRYASPSIANAITTSQSKVVRIRFFGGGADAITTSYGGRLVSVIIYTLSMPELEMHDGDVLQIDTGEYTVTLNGNNAVWMVTDLSEFFRLEPGEGTITIQFEDEGDADIRILWRERYM